LLVMALIPASWALVKSFMGFRAKCNDAIDSVSAYNFKIHCITEIWLNDIYFLVHEHMSWYRGYLTSHTECEGGVLIAISKTFRGTKWRCDFECADEYVGGGQLQFSCRKSVLCRWLT
jgi:hypothetical protein